MANYPPLSDVTKNAAIFYSLETKQLSSDTVFIRLSTFSVERLFYYKIMARILKQEELVSQNTQKIVLT